MFVLVLNLKASHLTICAQMDYSASALMQLTWDGPLYMYISWVSGYNFSKNFDFFVKIPF